MVTFDDFQLFFKENIARRSNTVHGIVSIHVSEKKKSLAKSGEELIAQVITNTNRLIERVWFNKPLHITSAKQIRIFSELLYDTITNNLQVGDAYKEEYEILDDKAKELRRSTGKSYQINRKYRVWDVPYSIIHIPPIELEIAMDEFYSALFQKIIDARNGTLSQTELLAYADMMDDGEIHAWADGCGRHATALVMWLSLIPDFRLPLFRSREEHHASIHNIEKHIKYFERCLDLRAE